MAGRTQCHPAIARPSPLMPPFSSQSSTHLSDNGHPHRNRHRHRRPGRPRHGYKSPSHATAEPRFHLHENNCINLSSFSSSVAETNATETANERLDGISKHGSRWPLLHHLYDSVPFVPAGGSSQGDHRRSKRHRERERKTKMRQRHRQSACEGRSCGREGSLWKAPCVGT